MTASSIQELDLALRAKLPPHLPRRALALDAHGYPPELLRHASRMIVRATVRRNFCDPSNYNFKDIESLYLESLEVDCPDFLREALNYLRLYQSLAHRIRKTSLDTSEYWFHSRILPQTSPQLLADVENVAAFDPQRASSAIVLGKIHAMQSRSAARGFFEDVEFDPEVGILQHDCGAATYFDTDTLRERAAVIASRRESMQWIHRPDRTSLTGARQVMLMSSDKLYLQVYLPYWLSLAEYLKPFDLAFHIIVTEELSSFDEIIEDAERLRRSLAILRGYNPESYGENISFSCVEVPDWCPSARSFAACARYLFGADLLRISGAAVIVQDIDLCIVEDPSDWLNGLPSERNVLVSNSVRTTVDPWRKFIAGTAVFQPSTLGCGLLERLESYLLAGLSERDGWYLDQNALTYVHETASVEEREHLQSHVEMSPAKRPLKGIGIDMLLQKQQKSATTTTVE